MRSVRSGESAAARKPARECALSLLERSDRTEREMRQKLKDREYSPEEIDGTLDFLKEYRYIDDGEYARKYVRIYSSRKSIRQIRCGLEQKGVARELIDGALGETAVDEETQIRAYLLKKGYRPGERMESAAFRKLTGALSRRGFSFDAIRRVTNQMCEEMDLSEFV
ncbi:MAG: regulatory protein RecX [Eubacteriales bacterium]|nr:regulatory protein RecX [Eubacteriales bacterium]